MVASGEGILVATRGSSRQGPGSQYSNPEKNQEQYQEEYQEQDQGVPGAVLWSKEQ